MSSRAPRLLLTCLIVLALGACKCQANAVVTCGDANGDGCLEWGTLTYCGETQACQSGACSELPPLATVLVSELVYDSPGSPDDDAFLELYGPPGTDLTGFQVVGVDGSNGNDYNAIALTDQQIGLDGFFVIANPNALATTLEQADLLTTKIDVQNGPDSLQLRWGGLVVDALAYGTFTAGTFPAGEGNPAFKTTTPGNSLARSEDEVDTDDNRSDFTERAATPGMPNVVPNQPPVAQSQCPAGVKAGDTLTFLAAASSDPDGSIVTYAFNFGDGQQTSGAASQAQHVYADAGSYKVELTVTDDRGAQGTSSCDVSIESAAGNQPPVADLVCPDPPTGVVGQELAFDGSGSSDPDGTVSGYTFTFSAEGTAAGAQATATHAFAAEGEVTVTLEVQDDEGATAQDACTLTIQPAGPPDKIISASTELCGAHTFGRFVLQGGATVTCPSGSLDVRTREILIDPASRVDLSATVATSGAGSYRFCGPACVCSHAYTGAAGGGNATSGEASAYTAGDARSPEMGGCLGSCVSYSCSGAVGGAARGKAAELDATAGGAGGTGTKPGSYYNSNYAHGGAGGKGWIKIAHGPTYSKTGTLHGATVVETVLPPLEMTSSTHPNPALVYNDTFATLDVAWEAPFAGVTGYWYGLSNSAAYVLSPVNGTCTTGTSASFPASQLTQAGAWAVRGIAVDAAAQADSIAARFDVGVNAAPYAIASSSHPSPDAWYPGTAVALSWSAPAGAAPESFPAFYYRVDRSSTASPADAKTTWTRTTNKQVVVTADAAGEPLSSFAYYAHLVSEDTRGNLPKLAAHFLFHLGAQPAKTTFFCYVKDGGGAAVANATVRLEPYGRQQLTDANGYFLLTDVYEGPYTLTATKGDATKSTALTIGAGTSPYTLTLSL